MSSLYHTQWSEGNSDLGDTKLQFLLNSFQAKSQKVGVQGTYLFLDYRSFIKSPGYRRQNANIPMVAKESLFLILGPN